MNDTLKFLYGLKRFGTKLGLESIKELLGKLGNPQDKLKVIHVAGTNGKGSICAMLTNILTAQGYKVGTYTSPHLMKFNERVTVNLKHISDKDIVRLASVAKKHYSNQTFFEFTTAIAFKYFEEQNVDFAVIEVGLGGRLDATNVVTPLVSIINNINLEHTEFLGNTIEEIAYEKGGIIKHRKPVITGIMQKKALQVIKNICKERSSKLYLTERYEILNEHFNINGHKNLKLSLKGEFQLKNAATAITAIDVINKTYKLGITEDSIRGGLSSTIWHGRYEFTSKNIIVDCAHNLAGVRELKKELKKLDYKKLILIIAIMNDKDKKGMLRELEPLADKIILTKPKNQRAVDPKELAKLINKPKEIISNVQEAVFAARREAEANDQVVLLGSIYLVGEAYPLLSTDLA